MFASRAYFSFSEITDPARHRDHNEWHQLDHRPENLLLPGVAWGDRWVRSPDCAAASLVAAPDYADVHYAIMYWFREPLEQTLDEWFALSERSFQWGRSPQIGWTRRPLRGLFVPLRGYVAGRVRVSADALPFRPVQGIFVSIARVRRQDAQARAMFRWYDEVRIPDLIECPGVAGAWSLASDELFAAGRTPRSVSWTFADKATRGAEPLPLRLNLFFLDGDPLEFVSEMQSREAGWRRAGRLRDTSEVEEIVFAGPLRRVIAWQWDWFNRENKGGT